MKNLQKKIKTYVIIVSSYFPKTHSKAETPTGFIENIGNNKLHTLRAGYHNWKKKFEAIEKGEAILSVRTWSATPYRSPQIILFNLSHLDGIGIEKLEFQDQDLTKPLISGTTRTTIDRLAKNDGLSVQDFKDWFAKYKLDQPLAVIHFTKFRYEV
mgnify:CR=1 FL=1